MAIYGEPKDGDFVRYIETLNRQAGATPGQVVPRKRSAALEEEQNGPFGQTQPEASIYTYTKSADQSGQVYPSTMSPGSTQSEESKPTSLATRSNQRHLALALTIAAVIALWNAVTRLITAVNTETMDLDNMVPVGFLVICAWMLFKAAQNVRRKQAQPLPKLSPLSVVKMGRTPKK